MKKPNIIGCEVTTPDGRGSIVSLHSNRVIVGLNSLTLEQRLKPSKLVGLNRGNGGLHRSYAYKDIEITNSYKFKDDD